MGRLQRGLYASLEQGCVFELSRQEKRLVKILEIIEIERHIPRSRQWAGRPAAKRRAMDRGPAKAMLHLMFGVAALIVYEAFRFGVEIPEGAEIMWRQSRASCI